MHKYYVHGWGNALGDSLGSVCVRQKDVDTEECQLKKSHVTLPPGRARWLAMKPISMSTCCTLRHLHSVDEEQEAGDVAHIASELKVGQVHHGLVRKSGTQGEISVEGQGQLSFSRSNALWTV